MNGINIFAGLSLGCFSTTSVGLFFYKYALTLSVTLIKIYYLLEDVVIDVRKGCNDD